MCKGFESSLTGPALQWYTSLPNSSIGSFTNLHTTFVEQFASNKKLEKHSYDLYTVKQKETETLRAYIALFNREKVSIRGFNLDTAISVFRKGLRTNFDLYKELTKYPCRTMEDVLNKTWAQIKWKEDEANQPSTCPPRPNSIPDRRNTRGSQFAFRICFLQKGKANCLERRSGDGFVYLLR